MTFFRENCFNATTIRNELERGFGLVAVAEGVIVGYLLAAMDNNLVDVLRLGVSPEFRRRGLGRKMMELILEDGSQTMLTVRKDNDAAIMLYHHLGFCITGQLSSSSWVMKRATSASA